MTSAGCTEYTHHTEALIYIKPRILKGFEFHKKFKFIPQVVENWKISEMRKGHYEPTCDLGRKSSWQKGE